ncbi:MAG: transporter, partial [Muribaculaceae bacterium]|nr:transporter [Muribaculaceae bacterium]
MDFITDLLGPGSEALPNTLILYSFVIAAGIFLGKLKAFGISLGVTFVLFVGILMGHFGYVVNPEVLKFVREFGLILFIFAIGLQVGPGFFSAFKTGGIKLNMLAVLGIALNVGIVILIYFVQGGKTSIASLVGVMSGAVTNTPGLAAAQQTVNDPEAINTMSMGYAAAYPLGVIGIIAAMLIIKAVFRIKVDHEIDQIEKERESSQLKPLIKTFKVTNKLIEGRDLSELHDIINCNYVISRIKHPSGDITIPLAETVVHEGDLLRIVLSAADEQRFLAMIGPEVEMEWAEEDNAHNVVSRRIVITKSKYNGVEIGSLRLHNGYNLNATRVNRAGVDLL